MIGRNETFATRERIGNEIVLGEISRVTDECGDGTGDSGMLGAGCIDETDFVRSGLLVGLNEENDIGINPMKLGIIAATDTHAATPGSVLESDWRGAVSGESTPLERLQPGLLTSGIKGNPGGLAGVWAEENSRDSIFDAMKRREVFGTSGPRIVPRFFGGWTRTISVMTRTASNRRIAMACRWGAILSKPRSTRLPCSSRSHPAIRVKARDPCNSCSSSRVGLMPKARCTTK